MTPRLSQSFPWSDAERGGFAVSAVAGSVLFALLYAWIEEPNAGTMFNPRVPLGSPAYLIRIPDPTYMPPFAVGARIAPSECITGEEAAWLCPILDLCSGWSSA